MSDADDTGVGLGARGVDPQHPRARVVGEADRAVEHPRDDHVADERLVAERQLGALVAALREPMAPLRSGSARRSPRRAAATSSIASITFM